MELAEAIRLYRIGCANAPGVHEVILAAAERLMDFERMVWVVIHADRHPANHGHELVMTFHGMTYHLKLVNGLPQMTPKLRAAIDDSEGSPYYE